MKVIKLFELLTDPLGAPEIDYVIFWKNKWEKRMTLKKKYHNPAWNQTYDFEFDVQINNFIKILNKHWTSRLLSENYKEIREKLFKLIDKLDDILL